MKRFIAFFLMLVLIVIAIIIGGYRSLSGRENEIEKIFEKDIQPFLDGMITEVYQISKLVEDSENLTALRERLFLALTVSEKYSAYKDLCAEVELQNQKYETATGKRIDAYYFFKEHVSRLNADEYNKQANIFNNDIEGFPYKYIAVITRIKSIELFK